MHKILTFWKIQGCLLNIVMDFDYLRKEEIAGFSAKGDLPLAETCVKIKKPPKLKTGR